MKSAAPKFVSNQPDGDALLRDVREGLSARPRRLPCKYLYDAEGSALFEAICELDEYYPTRSELEIFETHLPAITDAVGPRAALVEYGCGTSLKTRRLLAALEDPVGIVLIDISETALAQAVAALRAEFPSLDVHAAVADFTSGIELPAFLRQARKHVVFFPGSTIGNFARPDARAFLGRQAALLGPGGGLLVGVDLKKRRSVLEAAYNDRKGVTAAFNLNILARINRELGANFDLERFSHRALYREDPGRIEMWLIADADQEVRVDGERFRIPAGEGICTEYSAKYSIAEFQHMARSAGFLLDRVWTDARGYFSVHYGEVVGAR